MISNIVIRPQDLAIVQNLLHNTLPPNTKIWVFGSRAKGTTKEFADLDLAIDAGRRLTRHENNILVDGFKESDLPYKVDLVDLWNVSDNFKEIIEQTKLELPIIPT